MTVFSIRQADMTVAQEAASAILDSLKEKKTSKISAMKPEVQVVSATRTNDMITMHVSLDDREGTVKLTDSKIANGVTEPKDINEKALEAFGKQFADIDPEKFAAVAVAQANKVIERAARMSKDSVNNPNLKKKQAKAVVTPLF